MQRGMTMQAEPGARRGPTAHRRVTTVVALAAAGLLTAAGTAAADTGDQGSSSAPAPSVSATASSGTAKGAGDGARALCRRVPRIEKRIHRALKRLHGPARELGSIARLQKRVDNAQKAGHDAVSTYLNHKLTFRTSLVPTLTQRQKDLTTVRAWCHKNDNGKSA